MVLEGQFDATPEGEIPIATIVNFSVEDQPIQVNLHYVNRLFDDIEKYNSHFSMGNMMARMILSSFEPNEGGV
ncbi:hypothetical protein HY947_04295 [Candidatus Gottesmanbacteria bacterium]|nr:hypothetical protein [Candidatus Gottesmanbacteria bacterium]